MTCRTMIILGSVLAAGGMGVGRLGQGAPAGPVELSAVRAGWPVVCSVAASPGTNCQDCMSDTNGHWIRCSVSQTMDFSCPTACYYSSGIPTCTLTPNTVCSGFAYQFPNAGCGDPWTYLGVCGRTFTNGGTTWAGPPQKSADNVFAVLPVVNVQAGIGDCRFAAEPWGFC